MPGKKVSYEELLGLDKIEVEALHPPVAPKPRASEKDVSGVKNTGGAAPTRNAECLSPIQLSDDSKLALDFSYLTSNSSFQRAIIEFIKKFIPGFEDVKARGSKELMVNSFNANYYNYKECMVELKEKLKGRKIE